MKISDSQQDKAVTVNTFINARLNKVARVTNYLPMVKYLNDGHIQVLYDKLPKTDTKTGNYVSSGYGNGYYETIYNYGANDAEMYLEWLISVVQGYEQASEEARSKAYDQLCRFILILTDVTDWNKDMMLSKPYDWVTKLEEFETDIAGMIKDEVKETAKELETYQYKIDGYTKQLDDLIKAIEEKSDVLTEKANELKTIGEKQVTLHETQTNDLASMLKDVLVWMKKYGSVLDRIEKDYQVVTKPQCKGKTN